MSIVLFLMILTSLLSLVFGFGASVFLVLSLSVTTGMAVFYRYKLNLEKDETLPLFNKSERIIQIEIMDD